MIFPLAVGWLFYAIVGAIVVIAVTISLIIDRDLRTKYRVQSVAKATLIGAAVPIIFIVVLVSLADVGIGEEKLTEVSTVEYESVSGTPTIAETSWLVSTGRYTISIEVLDDQMIPETISCASIHTALVVGDGSTATITTVERTYPNPLLISMGTTTYEECEFTVSEEWANGFYTKITPEPDSE